MSDNIECPFCGIYFPPYPHEALTAHPPNASDEVQCPLSTYVFTKKQWDMRPPKKEVGHTPRTTLNELEQYLLTLVKELSLIRASKE